MTVKATKGIQLVIGAGANSMEFATFPGLVADNGLVTYTPGTISPTPDSVTVTLGQILYTSQEAWAEPYENPNSPDGSGADWNDFTPVAHDIAAAPYAHPNDWLKFAILVVATKAGYLPLVLVLGPEEVPQFALVSGGLELTGGSNPAVEGDTFDVTDTTVYTYPEDGATFIAHLILPGGALVEVPLDTPPATATISYLGGDGKTTSLGVYPAHQANDVAVGMFAGGNLDVAALQADGYEVVPGSSVTLGSYTVLLAWRRLLAPDTAFPLVANMNRLTFGVYRGLDVNSPISGIAVSLNTDNTSTNLVLPGLDDRPSGGWLARFRCINTRNGTMPPDAALTARVGINESSGSFYAMALADTAGVATSISEQTVAMEFGSRTVAYAVGLRAAEAA